MEGQGNTLYDGIKATQALMLKIFAKNGIMPLNPVKEKFDPNFHEALFDYVDPNGTPGTVGVVCSQGFMIQGRVLRPAKVGVIKEADWVVQWEWEFSAHNKKGK